MFERFDILEIRSGERERRRWRCKMSGILGIYVGEGGITTNSLVAALY